MITTLRKRTRRLLEWVNTARSDTPRRLRLESFGAIAQLVTPRALLFVDRDYARSLGAKPALGDGVWDDPAEDGQVGRSTLGAPLEAHLQLTNRCGVGCHGCYTGATPRGDTDEWGLAEWTRAVDALAELGVFHLALGGGESATLPWLGELARHARRRGMIPNLTTSGIEGLDELLPIADLFGQINVSIDGLGETYARVRGFDGFDAADRGVQALRRVKTEIGINVVVTRRNWGELSALFAYAKQRRLSEIELLRFKPAGRGTRQFSALTCTDAQHRALLPEILAASLRHRIRARVDCSYTPMIAHHAPGPDKLAALAVYGCTGGDFLIGAKASGEVTPCSFADPPPGQPRVDELGEYWGQAGAFPVFRNWRDADEPCRSCNYHALCRGGCRVVSAHLAGDASVPDPECPRVVDFKRDRCFSQRDRSARNATRLTVVG